MNVHSNAKLTPKGRELMVLCILGGERISDVATSMGISDRTVCKLVKRYKTEGATGLRDRSSRPHGLRSPTPDTLIEKIIMLRQQRLTGKHIARETGVSRATVSCILRRAGLSHAKDLEPAEPIKGYEHASPGDLIHLDIKRLGRFERPGHRVTGDRTGQSAPRSGKKTGYG